VRSCGRARVLALWAAAALAAAAGPAAAQGFGILHHETVPPFAAAARESSGAPAGAAKPLAAAGPAWSFVAFGRQFDVELEPDDRLLLGLDPERRARLRDVELYSGRLAGSPGSWVRLTRHGGSVSGVIWDGTSLYGVETESRVAPYLVDPGTNAAGVAIFRWQDTIGALRDEMMQPGAADAAPAIAPSPAAEPPSNAAQPSEAERLAALTSALPTPVGPGARLDVALVADEAFVEREGESAEAALLAMANVVDGIYVMQIGIQLSVADLVLVDAPGPFTQTDPRALLSELEAYKFSNESFRESGLAHLFTGRDLDEMEDSSGQLVGIANLGVVCSPRFGVALTQATFGAFSSALIAAHEIGHNFGAPHDGEPGSACEHEPPHFLMAASVTGARQFSQCSIEQMAPEVASAACLAPLSATNVSIRVTQEPPAEVDQEEPFELAFEIRNDGAAAAQSVEVTIAFDGLQGPAFVETATGDSASLEECAQAQPAYCRLPRLAPGETARYRLRFWALSGGPKTIDLAVAALNDTDASDNAASVSFDVRSFVDLASAMGTDEAVVYPDEEIRLGGVVRNVGLVDASGVVAELSIRNEYDIVDVDAGGADCVLVEDGYMERVQCRLGALGSGAERPVSWTLRPRPEQVGSLGVVNAGLYVFSAAPESALAAANNTAWTRLVRTDAKADLVTRIEAAGSFGLGAPVQLVVRVGNVGPDDVRDAVVAYAPANQLGGTIESISSSVGECVVAAAASAVFECRASRLAAGDAMVITFTGTAETPGSYRLSVAASAASGDLDPANSSATHTFTVVDPAATVPDPPSNPPPSSGGGGGAAGFAMVLGLLGAAAVRIRARIARTAARALVLGACAAALAPPPAAAQHDADDDAEDPSPGIELPDGEGKKLVQRACLPCHDLGGLAAFKGYWNREQWAAMVATMIGHGAKLEAAETEVVVDYLAAHFGVGPDHQQRETAE